MLSSDRNLWTRSTILSGLLASNIDSIIYLSTHRAKGVFLKCKSSHVIHQLSTLHGFHLTQNKSQSLSKCFMVWPLPNLTSSPTTLSFATMVNLLFKKTHKTSQAWSNSGPCHLLYPMPETLHGPSSKTHHLDIHLAPYNLAPHLKL